MLRTIGPVWDGNEVWLVVAGGATFAAFPAWYATMFSGFYVALLLILFFLIIRVVSFEWRSKSETPGWRSTVDVGEHDRQLRRRAPVGHRAVVPRLRHARSTRTATSPATSWISSARTACSRASPSCALFAFHGATFLTLRTIGDLRDRAEAVARRLAIPAAVLGAAYLVWTVVVAMDRNDKDLFPPALPAALGIVALALAVVFVLTGSYGRAFAMTGLGAISLVATLFVSLYPRVMVSSTDFENSLTVDGAASSHYALAGDERRGADLRPARSCCTRAGRTTCSARASAANESTPSSLSRVRVLDPRLFQRARAVRTLLVVDAVLARRRGAARAGAGRPARPGRGARVRRASLDDVAPALVLLCARRHGSGGRSVGVRGRRAAGRGRGRLAASARRRRRAAPSPPRSSRRDADLRGDDGGRDGRRRARDDLRALPPADRARRRRPDRGACRSWSSIDPLAAGVMLLTLPLVPVFMWLVGRQHRAEGARALAGAGAALEPLPRRRARAADAARVQPREAFRPSASRA